MESVTKWNQQQQQLSPYLYSGTVYTENTTRLIPFTQAFPCSWLWHIDQRLSARGEKYYRQNFLRQPRDVINDLIGKEISTCDAHDS